MNTKAKAKTADESISDSSQNVDQIREILFGAHIRQFEQRFSELEQLMEANLKSMETAFEKKLLSTQKNLQKSLEKVDAQLGAECAERETQARALDKSLGQFRQDAENQLAALDDAFTESLTSAQKAFAKDGKDLSNQMQSEVERLHSELNTSAAQLGTEKVSRAELAALLAALADQVGSQSKA